MNQFELMVGTDAGLFRLQDAELHKVFDTPVATIIADDQMIACALAEQGITVSRDGGRSWVASGPLPQGIVSLACDPNRPGRMIAGGQPASVWESKDYGQSWDLLVDAADLPGTSGWEIPIRDPNQKEISQSEGSGAAAWNVLFDPYRPDRIIVGVEVGGLMISDDNGVSWSVSMVGDTPDPHVICLHPADDSVALISTGFSRFTPERGVFRYSQTGGVYRSEDGFETFVSIWPSDPEPQYTRAMVWDKRAPYPATVCVRSSYVQASNPDGERRAVVKQSRDTGLTWHTLGEGEYAQFSEEYSAIVADPACVGDVYVATEKGRVFHVSQATGAFRQITTLPGGVTSMCTVQSEVRA